LTGKVEPACKTKGDGSAGWNMHSTSLRLISWNVAGRVGCVDEQVAAIADHSSDLVALQEVTLKTLSRLLEGLWGSGLVYSTDSFSLARDTEILTGPRRYWQLIASRWPLAALPPVQFPVPWPERVLSVEVQSPWGPVEVHTTHIPPGVSNGWTKIEMLEGIHRRLARESEKHRILCGDFNAPQGETEDGYTITFGQEVLPDGSVVTEGSWEDPVGRLDTMARWDSGERGVLHGLSQFDLTDVYRLVNGYEAQEYSWYWKGRGRSVGRRFDHVFASGRLRPRGCQYIHTVRKEGLSDHSAIEAESEPRIIR